MTSLPLGSKDRPQIPHHWRRLIWGVPPGLGACPLRPAPCPLGSALPSALCRPLPSVCPLPAALCPLPSALCPLPSPLCPLPSAPCCPVVLSAALVCHFERPLQGARCGLFDGKPCFSSSGRHRPRGPTTRRQSISAVLGCAMWLFLCRTTKGSKEQENPP